MNAGQETGKDGAVCGWENGLTGKVQDLAADSRSGVPVPGVWSPPGHLLSPTPVRGGEGRVGGKKGKREEDGQ